MEQLGPGRHRYRSVIEGCEMAAEFRRSGMTMAEFARQKGLSRRTVMYWHVRERELAQTTQAGFVELSGTPASPKALPAPPQSTIPSESWSAIEIRMPNGAMLSVRSGFDAKLLRDVLAIIGGPC